MAGAVTNGAQALLVLALLEKVSMSKKNRALGVFLSAHERVQSGRRR